jgi:HNH endonuclease
MDTKHCRVCGLDKPLDEMVKRNDRPAGRTTICKLCENQRIKNIRPDPAKVATATTKRCRVCGIEKPVEEMVKRKKYKDGVSTLCNACNREKAKQWAQENPEKVQEKDRRYRQQHPQKNREWARRWRLNNPEKAREKSRLWKATHQERERKRLWRAAHPEAGKSWAAAHREERRVSRRRTERANKEVPRVRQHRKRAAKRGVGGSFTVTEWTALKAKYDYRCLSCWRQEPEIRLHQDHVKPLEKYGPNTIDNIQPLCRECNSRKATKFIDYRPDAERKLKSEIDT